MVGMEYVPVRRPGVSRGRAARADARGPARRRRRAARRRARSCAAAASAPLSAPAQLARHPHRPRCPLTAGSSTLALSLHEWRRRRFLLR